MKEPRRCTQEIIREIERIWFAHPDWRFGQILENALRPPGHPERGESTAWLFYVEDDDVLARLKKT